VDSASFFKEKNEIPKDPGEILQKFGPEALKNCVKKCILDVDFMISRSRVFKDSSQKVSFLFPYLDALDSEVARDDTIGLIADTFRVERRAVWEDYNRQKSAGSGYGAFKESAEQPETSQEKTFQKRTSYGGFELLLLGAVFVNPGLFREIRSGFLPEDLEDPDARELYIILEQWFRASAGISENCPAELLDRIQDGNLRDFILKQEALGSFANPAKFIADGMLRMKIKILEKKRRELIRELRKIPQDEVPDNDLSRQEDLLAEKVYVDAELTRLKGTGKGSE
jgi:DNA primase